MLTLARYSVGVGDRFGRQGLAQLQAFVQASKLGVDITPVWNKSFREHTLCGTQPADVRTEARTAVETLGFGRPYHVDADHIGLGNVEGFLEACDFFTLDVADALKQTADDSVVESFLRHHESLVGRHELPGLDQPLAITKEVAAQALAGLLPAASQAAQIYRRIERARGRDNSIIEVSIDEADAPQSPVQLLLFLTALAHEGVPAQTVAPRFTGRFNKGVDYVGDLGKLQAELDADLAVIAWARKHLPLPGSLKLSVHSGSDKFSIYPILRRLMHKHGLGVHLKTAGTNWLEEVIGLAAWGGEGLSIVRQVYRGACDRFDEVCKPYATVIDIDRARLPSPDDFDRWSSQQIVEALRHDPTCKGYNPHVRQLVHVAFRIAAEMGPRYLKAVEAAKDTIAAGVTSNLLEKHFRPLFL